MKQIPGEGAAPNTGIGVDSDTPETSSAEVGSDVVNDISNLYDVKPGKNTIWRADVGTFRPDKRWVLKAVS